MLIATQVYTTSENTDVFLSNKWTVSFTVNKDPLRNVHDLDVVLCSVSCPPCPCPIIPVPLLGRLLASCAGQLLMSSVALCLLLVVLECCSLDCRHVLMHLEPVLGVVVRDGHPFPDLPAVTQFGHFFFLRLRALWVRIIYLNFMIFKEPHPLEPLKSENTAGSGV